MIDNNIEEIIYEYTIKNAYQYKQANVGSVLSKVISRVPDSKNNIKELRDRINDVVLKVNSFSREKIELDYQKYNDEFKKEYEEKVKATSKPNLTIEGAEKGNVITRFPPEPGGYIHIGNAKQCILSDEISKIYEGKIYLYWDDTNPEKCKEEYVESIKKDLNWLGIKFDKEYFASDNIDVIYSYGKKLIKEGNAYVCTCSIDEINKNRMDRLECKDRFRSPDKNLKLFEDMIDNKIDEGKAIVRFKGDMKSDNSAMRDPSLFRIKKIPHYRKGTKYVVWPTYHMNTPVLDSLNGITDVIRSKEYEVWDSVDKLLLSKLNLRIPRFHYEARLNIEGTITQKRVIRQFMADKYITKWDDPRLVTIAAMKRRGIMPQAIRNFVLRFGLSKTDTTVKMNMLLDENSRIINPIAKHLLFVDNPIKLSINELERDIKIKLLPQNNEDNSYREYKLINEIYLSKTDLDKLTFGKPVKLKDLFTIIYDKDKKFAHIDESAKYEITIPWVPTNRPLNADILIPGNIVDKNGNYNADSLIHRNGIIEQYAKNLSQGDILMLEKYGYFIVDNMSTPTNQINLIKISN